MNTRAVFHLISFMLMVLAVAMAGCGAVAVWFADPAPTQHAFLFSGGAVLAGGLLLWALTRGSVELTRRDGFGIVAFGWLSASVAGALPYHFSGVTPHFLDGLFETVSGLTTTGASILNDPNTIPRGVLLWRALTHFFGGMGILVFCVAILPILGAGGMQIYQAEVSGVSRDRLTPRIASTAKLLWAVYLLMNGLLIVLLRVGGMNWFDATCHAFATIATGGFSTQTASIGSCHSLYIESVLVVFMFLSAVSFALHYQVLHGKFTSLFRNAELRFFVGFWLVLCTLLTWTVWRTTYPSLTAAARAAVFSGTSILTTTGFCTVDFDIWPGAAKVLLILAMLIGGCSGSTCGAIKQVRLLVLLKGVIRQIRQTIHPQGVFPLRLGTERIEAEAVKNISMYVIVYLVFFVCAGLAMSFLTDVETAFSAVASTLGGVGPGLGLAGASESYAAFPVAAKALLMLCMLLGRLEFYTLLVILFPQYWRK